MQIHEHIERIILPFRNPDLQTHVIFNMLLKEWEEAIPSKFNFLHVNQRKMSVSRKSGVFLGGGGPLPMKRPQSSLLSWPVLRGSYILVTMGMGEKKQLVNYMIMFY